MPVSISAARVRANKFQNIRKRRPFGNIENTKENPHLRFGPDQNILLSHSMNSLRVPALLLPTKLPHPEAMKSWGQNSHNYAPDFWEFEYLAYRYLGGVAEATLAQRYRDLVRNVSVLVSPDRDVIPIHSFLSSWYWLRKEHQTALEYQLRDLPLPCDRPALILSDRSLAPARPRSPNAADVLFRYGRTDFLREMVDAGRTRISAAQIYETYTADAARFDDELNKHAFMPAAYTTVTREDGRVLRPLGDIKRTVSASNYFILCASCDWHQTLLSEFGPSCVIIRDPDAFALRLEDAGKDQIGTDWYFHHNAVQYFDPYEQHPDEVFHATRCKDFRYAYQMEYRWQWTSNKNDVASGFKFLELGPLQDIAEIHIT